MRLFHFKSLFTMLAFLVFGLAVAAAQTPDTSGNGLLKGSYRFRHLAVTNVDQNNDPSEITASYGTITFDGAGNYSVSGTTVDNTVSSGAANPLTVSGTYAIGSSGAGYVSNPLHPTDANTFVYGAVSQGVFSGSSTESYYDPTVFTINDIFVAIPVGTVPSNASFTSSYQTGMIDFSGDLTGAGATNTLNALFELAPNGKGGFGTISLTGQAANQNASDCGSSSGLCLNQSITGATYSFNSDGSATLTVPLPTGVTSANALFTGTKTIFQSADGNFILGWSTTGYDIFFGVKALAVNGTNSLTTGLYFTTALENTPGASGGNGTDSYYGGTNNSGDTAGDGILHERIDTPSAPSYDYGSDDQIDLNANGTTPTDYIGYNYIFGDGGQAFVAIGNSGFFSLQVGFHAATFSGTGVYLSPIGVVNAASQQPVTASIAPGELIVLIGSGLSSTTMVTQGGQVFPTTRVGVSVTIDGYSCPIYYVTSGQLAVLVPYEVAGNMTGLANIQVTNNKVQSNVVQVYLTDAAPGSFSANADGIGYAAATHALTGQVITTSNPVQPGEYISLYLTSLGTVTPTVADGALGPSGPLSWADVYETGNLAVNFNDFNTGSFGNTGSISFAGLTPTLAGLYQINVQVPTSGLTSGDNVYVEFTTDAADNDQIQIPYGAGAPSLVRPAVSAAARARAARTASIKAHKNMTATRAR
jgi:uncharacterized protein (TIGR03437 family)